MSRTTPAPPSTACARPSEGKTSGFLGLGLYRSPRHRLVGGVAGGVGERLGVDGVLIRAMFVVLTLAGGIGLLLYVSLWAAVPEDDGAAVVRQPTTRRALAVGMIVAGSAILLHEIGLWWGGRVAWSVGLATLGVAVIWARSGDDDRARWNRMAGRVADNPLDLVLNGRAAGLRLVAGALLVAAGLATFITTTDELARAWSVVLAVFVTVVGLGVLFGPWIYRLVRQLGEERRERIRSQERSDMAAHLHDSVLQTLALIQRTGDAREMVALARNQERELRAWLNDRARRADGTLAAALEDAASVIELQFKVPVEVVNVGDVELDERSSVFADACREAMTNAAKHSGAERVAVYLEVEPDVVTAFVRDQGVGFDPDRVEADRRGISDSLVGRMRRAGGLATISTDRGHGTEVQLTLARNAS